MSDTHGYVDGESLFIMRRRGRPSVAEPKASLTTNVPPQLHDRVIEAAKQHEVSVSSFVRKVLEDALKRRT